VPILIDEISIELMNTPVLSSSFHPSILSRILLDAAPPRDPRRIWKEPTQLAIRPGSVIVVTFYFVVPPPSRLLLDDLPSLSPSI